MRLTKLSIALMLPAVMLGTSMFDAARADSAQSTAVALPKRLFSFTIGTAVGTPIAIARCTHREVIKRTKEAYQLGGCPKPIGYVTAGFFGIPSGIFFGAGVGAADGVVDSWTHSKDEPLNKSSLSLEELKF